MPQNNSKDVLDISFYQIKYNLLLSFIINQVYNTILKFDGILH